MFNNLKSFWAAFWDAFKKTYNKAFENSPPEQIQAFDDTSRVNFLSIFITKLNSLANAEATFDVVTDSEPVKPLQDLVKNVEDKRFEVTADMLGTGEVWVFPATDSAGALYHRYVRREHVSVLATQGEKIVDLVGVIDEYVDEKNNVYLLNRRHTLEGDVLTIETYITDGSNRRKSFEPWAEYVEIYRISGATSIGVGRFKSPVSSRGLSPIYGVPLNFGCEDIETRLFNDLAEIETELKNNKSILFVDPLILTKTNKGDLRRSTDGWSIPENIFPIDTRDGGGNNIDIFAPSYRFDQLYAKLGKDCERYEQQVGVDKGFLTEFTSANTATEIRRSNASTISLIDKIHTAINAGLESTVEADCLFLGIPYGDRELFSIKVDWFDVFADLDSQYNRIFTAAQNGYAEKTDVMQWLFPNLDVYELQEKLERIKVANQQNLIDFNMSNIAEKAKEGEGNASSSPSDEEEVEEKEAPTTESEDEKEEEKDEK